jgi:hypothetical protein
MIKLVAFLIPLAFALVVSQAEAQNAKPKPAALDAKDAKYLDTGKPAPKEDPELAKFYMEEKSAPLPPLTAPVESMMNYKRRL